MNRTTKRVLHRHLHGKIFKPITAPLILAGGGTCTQADAARHLALHDVYVRALEFDHPDYLPRNYIRWKGTDPEGDPIQGQLRFHLSYNSKRVMVTGELVTLDPSISELHEHSVADLDTDKRLKLIASIARRAIQDLRERPDQIPVVIRHLVDVVELASDDVTD